jgi:hypothetical protein
MACVLAIPACAEKTTVKIGMVTDVGGVNDQSFNQTSWEGLENLAKEDPSFEVKYLESRTDADYQTNINTFVDEGVDVGLVVSVGLGLKVVDLKAGILSGESLQAFPGGLVEGLVIDAADVGDHTDLDLVVSVSGDGQSEDHAQNESHCDDFFHVLSSIK